MVLRKSLLHALFPCFCRPRSEQRPAESQGEPSLSADSANSPNPGNGAAGDGGCDLPLRLFPAHTEPLGPERVRQLVWLFLALGVAVRLTRYLLRFPLWCDEGYLAVNFLDRGYWQLIEPLEYRQVCPLLFLWVELALVKLLGFSEYSLRLFSLVCGLASLAVFRHLAGRLLQGTALVLAVAVFAVSYPCVRYSAEVKPYGSDVLVSLVLLALAVEWLRAPQRYGFLWTLAALMPLAVGLSYPAVFVAGGVSLTVAVRLLRSGCARAWMAWAAYSVTLVASFVTYYVISTANQSAVALDATRLWWRDQFPPLASPAKLLVWLWSAHAGDMLSHPFGGRNSGSTLTLLCCLVAVTVLFRRRRSTLLVLCLAPFALNFMAAALQRYPYGGHVRVAMFLTPIVCLLAGLGASWLVERLAARRSGSAAPLMATIVLLALMAVGSMGRDLWRPYRSDSDRQIRDFARWFWSAKSLDGEVVCLKTDLKQEFCPPLPEGDDSALYLCNQRIYSPRHMRQESAHVAQVSRTHPLRCVRFLSTRHEQDEAAFQRWLADMQSHYSPIGREDYRFPIRTRSGRVVYVQSVEVYEFTPRTETAVNDSPRPLAGERQAVSLVGWEADGEPDPTGSAPPARR